MIHYRKYDLPVVFTETVNGKQYIREVKGQYVSDDPRVFKVWFSGSTPQTPDAPIALHINVITHKFERFEESVSEPKQGDIDFLIFKAEEWLKTLPL